MLLDVNEIRVHYGGAEAVKGVSLAVSDGEIITVIGANGAGKTTIMRAIAGLQNPTSGEITFQGHRLENQTPHQIVGLGIALVPEGRRLFPPMTVLENLRMGAYLRKDHGAVRTDLGEIYSHFPVLKQRQNQTAGSLSGGEQQMLAIGRALMTKPKLLLLDEPSIGLSPLMIREIGEIITRINQQGVAIVLVEQNVRLALQLANRGYLLETGKVVLEGAAKDLLGNELVRKVYLGE